MTEGRHQPVPLRQRREAVIQRLCEHFAADHIREDELEKLIDRAHEARTASELEGLLQNLPVPSAQTQPTPLPDHQVELHQTVVAIMGGAERKGSWTPARMTRVFALMGGAVLDFRDVRMPAGTTEVQVAAIMGGVEIVVPPGMRVSSDGIGIMGGFEHSGSSGSGAASEGGPLLRITGLALMGGVEITVRYPGESTGEAKKRRKREARERRLKG